MAAGVKRTDAELQAQIDAGIRTNGNKEITPPIHNSIEQNIVKSKISKKDGGLVVDALLGYSVTLVPTDPKHFTPKEYVDNLSVGTKYWKGNPSSPAAGDLRETMVGTELQLQEYNGASWDVRSSR